jgi:hypothetical protein
MRNLQEQVRKAVGQNNFDNKLTFVIIFQCRNTVCHGKKHECISWISYAAEIKVLGQVTHVLQCLELDGRRLMAWQQSLQAFSGFVLLWLT